MAPNLLRTAIVFMPMTLAAFLAVSCRLGVDEPDDNGGGSNNTSVVNPSPTNGAANVPTYDLELSWDLDLEEESGITYELYLSTSNPPQSRQVKDYQSKSYTISSLEPATTYYWRVDAVDGSDVIPGEVWSFTTTSDVNDPPLFLIHPQYSIDEEQEIQFTVTATDPDGDSLSYAMTSSPEGATFSGNTFTWTPNNTQSGVHIITFTVSDNNSPALSDTLNIAITVVDVGNEAPTFSPVSDTTIDEGQPISFTLNATDPEGDSLSFTMPLASEGAELAGTDFSWTPGGSQSGNHLFRFVVTDDGEPPASDTLEVTITVVNQNQPPVLDAISDTTIREGQPLNLTFTATDPDGDSLIYRVPLPPGGATVTGNSFSWTPNTTQSGTYILNVIVTEATPDSLSDTLSVSITVLNEDGSGLVAYWDFNEGSGTTLTDRSGNGNDGTINGATWTNGIEGGALSFDGVDDVVEIPNQPSQNMSSGITIEYWFQLPDAGSWCQVSKRTQGAGGYNLRVDTGEVWGTSFRVFDHVADVPVSITTWHHLAWTYDNVNSNLYLDGVKIGSVDQNQPMSVGSNVIRMGVTQDGNGLIDGYQTGIYDEVKIYNRALTASEIAAEWGKYKDKIPPTSGLVAYWPFSGNANDASGNGNHGTVNGATLTVDRFGNANGAYSFDGVDDNIQVAYSASLNLTSAITLTAWVNIDTIQQYYQIVNGDNTGDYRLNLTDGELTFTIDNNNGYRALDFAVQTGTWHFLAATYDVSTVTLYMDGVQVGQGGFLGDMSLSSEGLYLGSRDGRDYVDGSLDDIRIYNRALSAAEIQVLYNEGN